MAISLEEVRRRILIALFSDDELMNDLVLKGGNALALVYKVGSRASVDMDFSIRDAFSDLDRTGTRIFDTLKREFRSIGYVVFDEKFEIKPSEPVGDQAEEFDAALQHLALGWRRLIRIGFREMAQGYFWRTETTYHFPSETFFPHRHSLIAVEARWFHGCHMRQDARHTFNDIWRTCCDREHDRGANGDIKVIKRDEEGNIDRGHLRRWCEYVNKPCHPILKLREPLGAFGLETGLSAVGERLECRQQKRTISAYR